MVIVSCNNFSARWGGTAKYFLKYCICLITLWYAYSAWTWKIHTVWEEQCPRRLMQIIKTRYISNIQTSNKANVNDQLHAVCARMANGQAHCPGLQAPTTCLHTKFLINPSVLELWWSVAENISHSFLLPCL